MFKKIAILVAALVLLGGCAKKQDPPPVSTSTQISGGFVATVRGKIQDFVFDEEERESCLIVTMEQGFPFIFCPGPEMTGKLETGKTYVFNIETKIVEKTLENTSTDPECAIKLYDLRVESFREAKENESTNDTHLTGMPIYD